MKLSKATLMLKLVLVFSAIAVAFVAFAAVPAYMSLLFMCALIGCMAFLDECMRGIDRAPGMGGYCASMVYLDTCLNYKAVFNP